MMQCERTENRGKFGFNFQMNIKDIIKKVMLNLRKVLGALRFMKMIAVDVIAPLF